MARNVTKILNEIINVLQIDTNNLEEVVYRVKQLANSGKEYSKIADYVVKSLEKTGYTKAENIADYVKWLTEQVSNKTKEETDKTNTNIRDWEIREKNFNDSTNLLKKDISCLANYIDGRQPREIDPRVVSAFISSITNVNDYIVNVFMCIPEGKPNE